MAKKFINCQNVDNCRFKTWCFVWILVCKNKENSEKYTEKLVITVTGTRIRILPVTNWLLKPLNFHVMDNFLCAWKIAHTSAEPATQADVNV